MIKSNFFYKAMASKTRVIVFFICLFTTIFSLTSCEDKKEKKRIVIWTNCPELAQYTELFNSTTDDVNAIVIYKKNPSESLPPAKDELSPDIIIGNWLLSEDTQKYFKSLDYLFNHNLLSSKSFYTELLDYGKYKNSQYFLPINFNLPAIIFANSNKELITDKYIITPEQIKTTANNYNKKNKKGNFEKIGYTPLSNENFLYLTTKLNNVNFRYEKDKITWNENNLNETIAFFKNWASNENSSAQEELDFATKYLFMPNYRQVTSGRTLFSYTTSDELFKNMENMELDIDYRWIANNDIIPIEDSVTMMGIYKHSKKQAEATKFITWFFNSETQEALLSRKKELNLNTSLFGIAGGLSSLIDVTEHILPIYYTELLTNLPPSSMLQAPQLLPKRWESYKSVVIEPYIKGKILANSPEDEPIFLDLEKEWYKKIFEQ